MKWVGWSGERMMTMMMMIYTHPSTVFFYIVNLVFSKHSSGFCNMVVAHTHTDRLTCYHHSPHGVER